MQYITLDTNAWINLANGSEPTKMLEAIKEGVCSGEVTIILPTIIIDEWNSGKHKILTGGIVKAFDEVDKGLGYILKSLGSNYKHSALQITGVEGDGNEVWNFFKNIASNFKTGRRKIESIIEENVATIDELFLHYTTRTVSPTNAIALKSGKFAIEKKAPFSSKNSFADALILFTFIDYVEKNHIKNAHFITYNIDDFCERRGGKTSLHPDLLPEFVRSKSKFHQIVSEAINQVYNEIELNFIEMLEFIQELRERPEYEEIIENEIYEEDEFCESCSHRINFYRVDLDDKRILALPGQLELEFVKYVPTSRLNRPLTSIMAGLCTNCQTEHFKCAGCGELNLIEDNEYNTRKECYTRGCHMPYFIDYNYGDWHEDVQAYTNAYSILTSNKICQKCEKEFWNDGTDNNICEDCQSEYYYGV